MLLDGECECFGYCSASVYFETGCTCAEVAALDRSNTCRNIRIFSGGEWDQITAFDILYGIYQTGLKRHCGIRNIKLICYAYKIIDEIVTECLQLGPSDHEVVHGTDLAIF